MKKYTFILSLFLAWSANSQDLKKYKKLYPNDDVIRLQQEIVLHIKVDNGTFSIKKDVFEEDLYLNNSANYNSKRSLSYATFFNLDTIEASSFSLLDDTYTENKVTNFNEKNNLNDSFYDDSKELSFIYPKLAKGSKTQLKLQYNIKNPRFLNAFFFGDFYPVIRNKVTIIADKDIELIFKPFHLENAPKITFKKKKKGKNYEYTWSQLNSEKFDIEANAPSYRSILPHIIPIITSYKENNETKKLLDGVGGLYSWYYSLVENINKEDTDQELVALVAELTKGKTSDLEKVKALYYWTQKNIKYIAFEYALGGFIPREANDVFQKKYGDCKDNSSILYKMLEIAGLEGNLTWIGTRKIPYTYEEVPTPAVDNHMILSYENNDKTYYLDATGRYIQIDYPSSFIQGKEALIADGKEKYKLVTVPIPIAEKNKLFEKIHISLDDMTVKGKSDCEVSGFQKLRLNERLGGQDDKEMKDFFVSFLNKGNNTFSIQNYEEKNLKERDLPYRVSYDFTIQNHVHKHDDELYINMHLMKFLKSYKIKKIPVIAANLNTITDSTYLKISGRDIIGSSQTKLSGYLKNNLFYNLENTRKEAAVKELYNKRFSKGSNKFLITSFTEENKFSYEEDFLVRYNFTIQDYVQNIGSEIFINPHINNSIAGIKTKKDRKYAIEFDYKKQYSYTNTIEIPEGYTVSYIPTSVSLGTELLSVNLSYSKVNNTLVCQQDVVFNFINLSVAAQQKVNAIIEQTEKAFKEIIVLQKK